MNIAATIVLAYFLARGCLNVRDARAKGIVFTIISALVALSLLIPLWAVWS